MVGFSPKEAGKNGVKTKGGEPNQIWSILIRLPTLSPNPWQSINALASQRLDVLLSMEAGAMGLAKETLTRDLVFASIFASNEV